MSDKVISKDDIDKMIEEIKVENKKKDNFKKYIQENKEEVVNKIKKIEKDYSNKFKIMKFLMIIDLIFLIFFVSPSNFFLQFFTIISMFYAFNIFFKIRSKIFLGLMGNYLFYLFFLFVSFTMNIINSWNIFNNFYGYFFILVFLYCHLIFFAKKFYLNKLLILSYLLLVIVVYGSYFSSMYIDINNSMIRNESINETISLCEKYEEYSSFCDFSIIRLNQQFVLDDCILFSDNLSKSLCVNHFKKKDKFECNSLNESLIDFCN